jgi:putative endonuclease
MQIEDTLVRVEVRFRARGARVSALESVDARKQRRLCRAAGMFLSRTRDFDACPVRFDVVAITRVAGVTRVNWQPAAFDCQGS